jgi:hypothetical protein
MRSFFVLNEVSDFAEDYGVIFGKIVCGCDECMVLLHPIGLLSLKGIVAHFVETKE